MCSLMKPQWIHMNATTSGFFPRLEMTKTDKEKREMEKKNKERMKERNIGEEARS